MSGSTSEHAAITKTNNCSCEGYIADEETTATEAFEMTTADATITEETIYVAKAAAWDNLYTTAETAAANGTTQISTATLETTASTTYSIRNTVSAESTL